MMCIHRLSFFFLLAFALLAGCASVPATDRPTQAQAAVRDQLQRSGRFALSVTHSNQQQEAVQGGFSWYEKNGFLQLDLRNPMGSTLARVTAGPQGAVLVYSDGRQEQAASADALVDILLGSPIPVSGLRDWMRGQVAPAAPVQNERHDTAGALNQFEQDGWRVSLQRYDSVGPRVLQLNRHEPSRSISVRLIVDQ